MASTDRPPVQAQDRFEPSPSTSSSTLIVTPLPSKDDSPALPRVVTNSAKALRPSSLFISLPPLASSPPPQRSGKGFVEPHRSHLPRRAKTPRSKGITKVESPRRSTSPERDDASSLPPTNTQRHSFPSANENNGHMPTHLLSLRIAEPSIRTSLPQTPPLLPRTPQILGTPSQTPKGHLEPQSANLPRRHQRQPKAQERDGSPVSKVRHSRSASRSRLTSAAGKDKIDGDLEGESLSRREERRAQSRSRHHSRRLGSGSPSRAVGNDAERSRAAEDTPLHVKERSRTCLQEMGKSSGIFVGFLPSENDEQDLQEPMHVVVQSKAVKLVLPLPRRPSPIPLESDIFSGSSEPRSTSTCVEPRAYMDGVTALTDTQIQDGCAFIVRAKQTPQDGAELPSTVRILSPRLRPEDAMSLAICYLAYSSPSFSMSASSRPPQAPHSPNSTHVQSASAPPSPTNDGDTFIPRAARLIPSGSASAQQNITRSRILSFPGSWDDESVDIDIINPLTPLTSNPTPKEPSYTPAHALYMHLLDDIEDVDPERGLLWDDAILEDVFNGPAGVVPLGFRGPESGESDEGQMPGPMVTSDASTTKSVFGGRGSYNRRLRESRDRDRDCDRGREREREERREEEYRCIRAEWRGVLSFDGLTRLDGVWLGES